MIKLNKTQTDALSSRINTEIYDVINEQNKAIKKEAVDKFLKTDAGKAVMKVNNSFFDMTPISNGMIETLSLKYFEVQLKTYPGKNNIYSDIVLSSIDSTSLDELIASIKAKYNV